MDPDYIAVLAPANCYLTIPEAHEFIISLGFKDTNLRQVVRWASEKRLPFFRWGKKLYIERNELEMCFKRVQQHASKRGRHL